ncbi:MAG: InlB B-repeat-containing protein, partial [Clostridiales bacterium]|nr:InlB B-repeat-containing protein [Clostridiales bacterium]
GVTEERRVAGFTLTGKAANYASSGSTTTQAGLLHANSSYGSVPSFVINGGTFINTDTTANSNIFVVTGANKRDVQINGGLFQSGAGQFLFMYNTDKDVVMTGGVFENTGNTTSVAVTIGNYSTAVYTQYSHDPSRYATFDSSGRLNETAVQGYGGKGILYLNGGEIRSNNNTTGLINVTKNNQTTAVVMGLEPRAIADTDGKGYIDGQKSDKVTKLVNKGSSAMIRIAPGINTTTSLSINGANRTIRIYTHSNSAVVIDRVDFEYSAVVNQDSVSYASIVAPQVLPEVPYPINFPTLRFTGTLAGGTYAEGGAAYSGLIGRIRTGVNVVELAPTFNDAGYAAPKPHILEIENLNQEIGLNGTLIRNVRGDGQSGGGGYRDHFSLYTQAAAALSGLDPAATAGYAHTEDILAEDWVNYNVLAVNWYTQKGIDGDGASVATAAAVGDFTAGNVPKAYDKNNGDEYRSRVYRADNGIKSNMTYNDVLGGFVGPTFEAGHVSAGMPKLSMPGYVHQGWTYTGMLSPYYSPTLAGLTEYGIYTTPVAEAVFVRADDPLKNHYDHFLEAQWSLDNPRVAASVSGAVNRAALAEGETIGYGYAVNGSLTLTAAGSHDSSAHIALTLSYSWEYMAADSDEFLPMEGVTTSALSGIKNVAQNGAYRVTVTATDNTYPRPMTSTCSFVYVVDILPKAMTAANIHMPAASQQNGERRYFSPKSEGFYFYDELGRLELTEGDDFRASPTISATYSAVGVYTFYFDFYGNYSGSNVQSDFIIYGDAAIYFSNLINGSTISTSSIPVDQLDVHPEDNSVKAYPQLPVPSEIEGYSFLHWTHNAIPVYSGDKYPANDPSVTLVAVWALRAPVLTTSVGGSPADTLVFEFDRTTHHILASAKIGTGQNDINGVTYAYTWYRFNTETGQSEGAAVSGLSTLPITYVQPLTAYRVTVTASASGLTSTASAIVHAEVKQKMMTAADILITPQPYDGQKKTPTIQIMHNGYYLAAGTDYTMQEPIGYENLVSAGDYVYTFTFINNYASADTTVEQTFKIYTDVTLSFGNLKPNAGTAATAGNITLAMNSSVYPALPDLNTPGIAGYDFLRWEYNGAEVEAGDPLRSFTNHTLMAVWQLKDPTVSISQPAGLLNNELEFVYDRAAHALTVSANVDGLTAGLSFTYAWTKTDSAGYTYTGATNYFTNVSDKGTYLVTVWVTDGNLTSAQVELPVTVTINKKDIGASGGEFDVNVAIPVLQYADGAVVEPVISITHQNTRLQPDTDFKYDMEYFDTASGEWVPADAARYMGTYKLTIKGAGNYKGERDQTFVMTDSIQITFIDMLGTAPPALNEKDLNGSSGSWSYQVLAVPTNQPEGYTFLGWTYDGTIVHDNSELAVQKSHVLTALWALNEIVIEDEAALTAGIDKPYTSGGYTLTVTPSIADKDDNANIIYTYVWYDAGGNPVTTLDTLSLNAVQDQAYSVTVTATGLSGLTRTKTVSGIRVRIAKLSINDSGVLVTVPSKNLLSSVSTATFDPIVTFGGVTLHEGVDYEITFWDADAQEFAAERPTVYGVGSYTFTFAGIGNFEDERTAAFTVTSLVAISFYTQIGTAPAAVTPENGRYPALGAPANFPQGYRFVGWQYNGATVQAGEALALDGSHMLVARFVLNEITLTNADAFAAGLGGVYIRDGYSITAQPAISGVDNLIFSYEWRSAGGALIVNTAELKRNGVSDSGVYTLTVKALDGHGIRPESDLVVTLSVVITPKDIGDDDVSIAIPQKTVNGSATTDLKPDNVVTSYNRGDMSVGTELALKILSGGSYVAYDADAAYPAGTYTFRFEGIGNFTGEKYVLFNVVRMDSPEISFYSMLPGVTLPANIPIVAGVTYQNLQAPGDVPPGYAFLCWTRDGEDIADGAAVPDHSHTLVARYGLDESAFSVSAGADYYGSYDFSDGHTVTTTAALKGDLLTENHAMFRLSYVWQKDAVLKSGRLLYFGDVGDSGDWTVTVTVQDMLYGLTLTKTDTVKIEVAPITLSGFAVNPDGVAPGGAVTFASAYRTGQVRNPQFSVSYGANRLRENVDYTVVALGEVTAPGYLIAEGVYPFRIEAVDGGNYTDSLTVEFEIILKLTIYFSSEIPGVTSHNPLEPGSGTYSDADLLPLTAEGYTFEYWTLAGTKTRVNVGDPIVGAYNIYLTAVWTLNAPVKMSATADFRYEYDADTMREMTLAFTHSISDRLNAAYSWSFTPVGGTARTLSAASATYAIKNAAESGVYVLTVTLSDDAGRTAVLRQTFAVEITAKPLTADNVSISAVYYNGAVQPPVVEVADTASGGRTLRLTEGTDYVRLADGNEYRNARDYTVNIRFTGNYSQVGAAVGATYRILPWTVSFDNLGGLTALPVKTTEDGKYPALPRLTGLSGYTFDGWQYAGVTVGEGDGIKESRNHALTAVWKLNAPTVTAADIGGEYKWSPYLSTASVSVGTLVNGTDMQLYYKWIRLSDNAVIAEGTAANVLARANVADSGIYRLEVYATDLKGLTLAGSERSLVTKKDVRVRITPKRLTADDLVLPAQVYTGSGIKAPVTVTNDGNTLELSSDFMVYYQGADAVNADFTDIGAYELSFVGAGNFTGEFTAEFVIEKSDSIIASWWLWVVVAMGAAAVAATVMIIRAYLAAKRKKYGMKRHIRSFMDDFDRAM